MTQDVDVPKKPAPKSSVASGSVLSGLMVALLDRNDDGVKKTSSEQTGTLSEPASLVAMRRGRIKSSPLRSYFIRRLRTLLTPLLHRLELRARTTIEKTGLAANIFEVRSSVTAIQRDMESLRQTCDQILGRLAEPRKTTGAAFSATVTPLGDGLIGVLSPFGLLAIDRSSPSLLNYLIDGDVPDRGTIAIVNEYVESGGSVLSIGAGSGLLELAAAKRVGQLGSVIVFEPGSTAVKAMEIAASINRVADVLTVYAMPRTGSPAGETNFDAAGAERMFETVVPTGRSVALVKIELHGGELDILRALRRVWLENPQSVAIVKLAPGAIDRSGRNAAAWLETVGSLGFVASRIDETSVAANSLRPSDLKGAGSIDILLVRGNSSRSARLLPADVRS